MHHFLPLVRQIRIKAVTEGITASQQTWSSRPGSRWSRPSTWAAPTTANLLEQDHTTDREHGMDLHLRRGIQGKTGNLGQRHMASQGLSLHQQRPRDDARNGYSGAAGDTSEGSTAGPALISSDRMSNPDEELLRKIADGVIKALATKGSGQ